MLISIQTLGEAEDEFEAIRISNVPFPRSFSFAASVENPSHLPVMEFTVCYRFLLGSYNGDHYLRILTSTGLVKNLELTDILCCYDAVFEGPGTLGWGTDGYQGGYASGGHVTNAIPSIMHFNLAKNIETFKWQHICSSYSSTLKRFQMYQNGLKVFSFDFKGDTKVVTDGMFANIGMGQNMRGLITDANVFSKYFDEEEILSWTRPCNPC